MINSFMAEGKAFSIKEFFMTYTDILLLLGGIGLFIFGMNIMSNGLRSACGDKLRIILERATRRKITSVAAGLGTTVLIQSSSATDVMVIGFVSSGLMSLSRAVCVIMGANIGTTVTAQITAFNISTFAPAIIFVGAALNIFIKNKSRNTSIPVHSHTFKTE